MRGGGQHTAASENLSGLPSEAAVFPVTSAAPTWHVTKPLSSLVKEKLRPPLQRTRTDERSPSAVGNHSEVHEL